MTVAVTVLSEVGNDAKSIIELGLPYIVHVRVEGTSELLFHRWSVDGVEAKAKAAKGSKAKKQDDIETYVFRGPGNMLSIPTEYFRMAAINAARFKQDPRSPRKSAFDLFKAGIVGLSDLCSLGKTDWDFIDRRRVMVQRNGITRHRPGFYKGWRADMDFQILLPEYISPPLFNETLQAAGRLIGVGDFRPTFGRFQIIHFAVEAIKI